MNILTDTYEIGRLWCCLLEKTFNWKAFSYRHHVNKSLSRDMLAARLWITEVWDASLSDPVGFRTARELAGKFRFLLIFNYKPEKSFPDEGPFWITYSYFEDLKKKIDGLINNPPLPREEYEELAGKYPQLISKPVNYHHHH